MVTIAFRINPAIINNLLKITTAKLTYGAVKGNFVITKYSVNTKDLTIKAMINIALLKS
jgi:hypothetical protein